MLRYRVTATLLNSWQRIFDAKYDVKESEKDEISFEAKVQTEMENRTEEFINLLKRIPTPDNEYMRKGREFENIVCTGGDPEFSPIVNNGAFQVTVQREVDIDGVPLTLYGVLDVLKAGRIMDIKRVVRYSCGKYKNSHQHSMYLYLVPEALDFTYLICDDNIESDNLEKRYSAYHYENYVRENSEDILQVISQFLSWLKANNLFDIYIQKWVMK
jgi:hypothetical protein